MDYCDCLDEEIQTESLWNVQTCPCESSRPSYEGFTIVMNSTSSIDIYIYTTPSVSHTTSPDSPPEIDITKYKNIPLTYIGFNQFLIKTFYKFSPSK